MCGYWAREEGRLPLEGRKREGGEVNPFNLGERKGLYPQISKARRKEDQRESFSFLEEEENPIRKHVEEPKKEELRAHGGAYHDLTVLLQGGGC